MAVSTALQNALNAKSHDAKHFFRTKPEAVAFKATCAGFRRVEVRKWNNGTRHAPRWEYMVLCFA